MHPKDEPRVRPQELAAFMETLGPALDAAQQLAGVPVKFVNLPVEEWSGPGYAVAALYDPVLLGGGCKNPVTVWLDADGHPRFGSCPTAESQKEFIRFNCRDGRRATYRLPQTRGKQRFYRLPQDDGFETLATIAELPALLVKPGEAVFAFHPLRTLHRYLTSGQPEITFDFTDLLVQAVTGRSAADLGLGDCDLRRDFHALGINIFLIAQLGFCAKKPVDLACLRPVIQAAAQAYNRGDQSATTGHLETAFRQLSKWRKMLVPQAIYIMNLPHGGILFPGEGYAEYDAPCEAAQVLNLYLDWSEKYGYKFAPEVGAGTWLELSKHYPQTIARLRRAWDEGRIELVNGNYAQPYLQWFPAWDQDKQFERGQAVIKQIFGRPCTVYAAQEAAHHPMLPGILVKHGYTHAIHRCQNLGVLPVDRQPLVNWAAPTGESIRTLPAHPLRSERRGAEFYRHFAAMLTAPANAEIPFTTLVNFMDQTYIETYTEEVVRSLRYASVWGEFVTPGEFFRRTTRIEAPLRQYHLDDYYYAEGLCGNPFHGHQTGGYSSQHAFLLAESSRLQQLEQRGELSDAELDRFLNQQAHDCYIIPYFTTGYFMQRLLCDYNGPHTPLATDRPHGALRFIRDAAGYPQHWADRPAVEAQVSRCTGLTLAGPTRSARFDPDTGALIALDGKPANLGVLTYRQLSGKVRQREFDGRALCLTVILPGFGEVEQHWFFAGDFLYCQLVKGEFVHPWDAVATDWHDCVALCHQKTGNGEVLRTVCGLTEATDIEYFHSIGQLAIGDFELRHGGNQFFRQQAGAVENRLWCYGEFCREFWFAVK